MNNLAIYDSTVAACNQSTIMALPIKIGSCRLSLAVDTGATLNVLWEDSFSPIKGNFRGGRTQCVEAGENVAEVPRVYCRLFMYLFTLSHDLSVGNAISHCGGNHEIRDREAMRITITVPNAPIDSDKSQWYV
ncbi:hypothetical protein E2C01_056126 [Portunus trituberculatus]|uniref:Uncharacterized protein n=1 Tax=Portunus trituberculatus TaxID=210409 RepID=A0A5B7GWR4_PORTR|nr:hypothetical protein [Portunus trituberculatus]